MLSFQIIFLQFIQTIQANKCKFGLGFLTIKYTQVNIASGTYNCNLPDIFNSKITFDEDFIFQRNFSDQEFTQIYYSSNLQTDKYFYEFNDKFKNKLGLKIQIQYFTDDQTIYNDQSIILINLNWYFWIIVVVVAIILLIIVYQISKCCKNGKLDKIETKAISSQYTEQLRKQQSMILRKSEYSQTIQQSDSAIDINRIYQNNLDIPRQRNTQRGMYSNAQIQVSDSYNIF